MMRQAIVTKYHGPTNKRGSRISATCQAKRIMVEYDDAMNLEKNHISAALKLCIDLQWNSAHVRQQARLVAGWLPGTGDAVHVLFFEGGEG